MKYLNLLGCSRGLEVGPLTGQCIDFVSGEIAGLQTPFDGKPDALAAAMHKALAALLTGMRYGDRTAVHVDFTLTETPTSPDVKRQDLARDLYGVSARLGGVDRLPEDVVAPFAG
jgi:hypothetical protein